jgi:hypothetical protein
MTGHPSDLMAQDAYLAYAAPMDDTRRLNFLANQAYAVTFGYKGWNLCYPGKFDTLEIVVDRNLRTAIDKAVLHVGAMRAGAHYR